MNLELSKEKDRKEDGKKEETYRRNRWWKSLSLSFDSWGRSYTGLASSSLIAFAESLRPSWPAWYVFFLKTSNLYALLEAFDNGLLRAFIDELNCKKRFDVLVAAASDYEHHSSRQTSASTGSERNCISIYLRAIDHRRCAHRNRKKTYCAILGMNLSNKEI